MIELASSAGTSSFISHFPQQQQQQKSQQSMARQQQPAQIPMELSDPLEPQQSTPTDQEFLQMVYGHPPVNATEVSSMDISSDSAVSSNSGRTSNVYTDFRDYVRGRRQTITSKLPINRLIGNHSNTPRKTSVNECNSRKASVDSQFNFDDNDDDNSDDETLNPNTFRCRRRMSVPEKTLMNMNYAILRKSIDRKFEIVGAFHKHHSEAYRNFLQSLTCYDLAPQHGVVMMLDASLTIHRAVTIMCLNHNSGHRAAIVCNANNRDKGLGIFTLSDCLKCLQLSSEGVEDQLGEKTLQHFLDTIQSRKKLTTVSSSVSVWDVSKLFRLNRVHRIPVFQDDDFATTNEVLSFVCLRGIFVEIVKLLDSKCSLTPNLHCLTVDSLRLGTWTNIAWIPKEATCADAIRKCLNRKVSCLPMLDEDQNLVGVVTKGNIIDAIAQRPNNYMDILEKYILAADRVIHTIGRHIKIKNCIAYDDYGRCYQNAGQCGRNWDKAVPFHCPGEMSIRSRFVCRYYGLLVECQFFSLSRLNNVI